MNGGTSYSGTYFVMTNDIKYDYSTLGETESNYTPIGGYNSGYKDFCGHFDGQNYTISGIRIYKGGTNYADCLQGIFGSINNNGDNKAEVKNVILADTRITAYQYVGGIVGQTMGGTIENCHVLSNVTIHALQNKAQACGGIVGYNSGCTVIGCTSAASITTYGSDNQFMGGIVGRDGQGTVSSTVRNCLYLGNTVEGKIRVGAIVGQNYNGTVSNSYFTSTTFQGKGSNGNTLSNADSAVGFNQNGTVGTDVGLAYSITLGAGITCSGNALTVGGYNVATSGQTITLSASRTGYDFGGYESSDVTITDGTFTMPAKAVTVSALWTPSETVALTANQAEGNYWTTFYCGDADYQIATENACAYTAEYDGTNQQLTLTKRGADIPKGEAVIIVGGGDGSDASVGISLSKTTGLADYSGTNHLHGVDVRTLTSTLGTGTFYVMGKQGTDFGFFEYTGQYMPARKAYLLVSGSNQALARGLTMVFADGNGSAGISPATVADGDVRAPAWYTLDGRRLEGKPTAKGIYVNNGRKVVIK